MKIRHTAGCFSLWLVAPLLLYDGRTTVSAANDNVMPLNYRGRAKANVNHLRAEPPALRLTRYQACPPKTNDQTRLDGGAMLGGFWRDCKSRKKCKNHPYTRLLTSPILKADYRN